MKANLAKGIIRRLSSLEMWSKKHHLFPLTRKPIRSSLSAMSLEIEPALTAGMVFSDSVIREQGTNKQSYIGSFQVLNVSRLPTPVAPFFVTAFISNIRPEAKQIQVVFQIKNPKDGVVLFNVSIGVQFNAPPSQQEAFEVTAPVIGVVFQTAGLYKVCVLVDSEFIGERNLHVKLITSQAQPMEFH